jgi:hypothetical protein
MKVRTNLRFRQMVLAFSTRFSIQPGREGCFVASHIHISLGDRRGRTKFEDMCEISCKLLLTSGILLLEERIAFPSTRAAGDTGPEFRAAAVSGLFAFLEQLDNQKIQFGKVFLSHRRSSSGGKRGSSAIDKLCRMSCNCRW